MESRCAFCFHPLGSAAGATAACHVCGKAPTTTSPSFGSSSAKAPSPSFGFTPAHTQSSEPAGGAAGMFGPTPASPSAFGFSTTASFGEGSTSIFGRPQGPSSTSVFGQPAPPATASPSAFGLSTMPQPSFGQPAPPATASLSAFGFSQTPQGASDTSLFGHASAAATASSSVFGITTTPQPSFGQPSALSFSHKPQGPSSTSLFGQPSALSLSHKPQGPPSTSMFGQPAPPATASAPAFGFSTTQQPSFGWPAPAYPPMSSTNTSSFGVGHYHGSRTESHVFDHFDDDEPVEDPPAATLGGVQSSSTSNVPLVLKTHCELPAVARGCSRDSFAVLVHAKAPSAAAAADQSAPLDLVTVLDVSSSMEGGKLALLKEAMGFVIDKLGPADRLSVVCFSNWARRVTPLTRMSEAGKASTKFAVESLVACGSTDILAGIDTAAKVLDGRRYRNAVASVILLSDGQDNTTLQGGFHHGANTRYEVLVPRSLAGSRSTPIHTFGFGTDHDAKAMHAIAEATGGTYSFIENQAVVQDAFAQCIGGLLSVAVQEAWISVTCPHPDVRVRSVKSGRYESQVVAYGRAASVDVGELYADEERRFLLFVDVPRVAEDEDVTRLIRVSCTYKDMATGKSTEVAGEDAVVRRPVEVTSEEDQKPSMEVQVERFRVEATEDIAAARAAAERGDHAEAAQILDRRREAAGTGDMAGDGRCAAVVYELAELSARVATRREYEQTGRSSILAGMRSHAQQRAASVNFYGAMAFGNFGACSAPAFGACPAPAFGAPAMCGSARPTPTFGAAFVTPAMQDMVDLSRKIRDERERHQK